MSVAEHLGKFLHFARPAGRTVPFPVLFRNFKSILRGNNEILELLADMGEKLTGESVFDRRYIMDSCERIGELVFKLISDLSVLTRSDNADLFKAFERIRADIQNILTERWVFPKFPAVLLLDELGSDSDEAAGSKFANLGEIRNALELRTPEGFVITVSAFFDFMEQNGLFAHLDRLLKRGACQDEAEFEAVCQEMRSRILAGSIPARLLSQLDAMRAVISKRYKDRRLRFAVRSSAWGEDGRSSFAGQYESVLNVPGTAIADAYRRVVASAYSPEAWAYRLHRGYKEHEMAMAVGCQAMVPALASGVIYSLSPLSPEKDTMLVNAAWGLGPAVMQGGAEADTFVLDKTPPYRVLSQDIRCKMRMMAPEPGPGPQWTDVAEALRQAASLSPNQLAALGQAAGAIENHFKRPQDIEWALDRQGTLHILQCRPLNIKTQPAGANADAPEASAPDTAAVIFAGRGTVVHRGVAAGKVYVCSRDEDIAGFPDGAILVSPHTSPKYARVMRKARGIITDLGSATGHMAALAREYQVPAVVDTGTATKLLQPGEEITLDAVKNVIYRGKVPGLVYTETPEQGLFQEAYEYRLLKRLLKKISSLRLIDPFSADFKPDRCRTYHDIIRYIHEKAVERLIDLSERFQKHHEKRPKRLISDPPLGLVVVDIEDGTQAPRTARSITADQIRSLPLKAMLDGLSESGMWTTEAIPMQAGSLMASIARSFASPLPELGRNACNLVLVSKEYMNLTIKLGYHFTMIDAYIGNAANDNYIYFRFSGGVADLTRRSRRGRFIAAVLRHLEFSVDTRADVVVGRLKKDSSAKMYAKMKVLGGLIGYARQLDVCMSSDEHVNHCLEDFLQRIRPFEATPDDSR